MEGKEKEKNTHLATCDHTGSLFLCLREFNAQTQGTTEKDDEFKVKWQTMTTGDKHTLNAQAEQHSQHNCNCNTHCVVLGICLRLACLKLVLVTPLSVSSPSFSSVNWMLLSAHFSADCAKQEPRHSSPRVLWHSWVKPSSRCTNMCTHGPSTTTGLNVITGNKRVGFDTVLNSSWAKPDIGRFRLRHPQHPPGTCSESKPIKMACKHKPKPDRVGAQRSLHPWPPEEAHKTSNDEIWSPYMRCHDFFGTVWYYCNV